jgi:Na+-transporting NADH:ubiquinone oxidoreductase subunit C
VIRANPLRAWRDFLRLPNESLAKTLGMALLVSGACAVAVSFSAVALKPVRQANLEAAQRGSLLETLRALPGMRTVLGAASDARIEAHLVELESGALRDDEARYDVDRAASDPASSLAIPDTADLARLGRREKLARVYLVHLDGRLALVVLPVRGRGYQSMLKGYLVLESDLTTVAALTFYEQQETPGIGTRVTDPEWLERFRGKQVFSADGAVALEVVTAGASGPHQVDGISGATRTATGVHRLLRFWLGPAGFGPFLERLGKPPGGGG